MRKLFQLILISLLSFGTHAQQISLVQDFGTNGLKLDDTAVFNGNLYFSTQEEAGFASTLYSVDSNDNITPLYTSTSSIFNLVQLGNHIYFTATGTSGWAFYRIDSSGAVSLVSETNTPFLDAIVYNDEIYFSSVNGGADLYAYSEITNSFRLVDANFDYGMGVGGLIVHNGELYFRGTIEGSTSNRALFKTNGSTISQVVAFDSQIYQDISNPYTFISFGNELYFSAPIDASLNYQLFKVNTNSNQLALASTYYVVNNHIPFVFNNELYFTGRPSINSNSVYELLKQNELGVITSIPLGTENGQIEVGPASFGSISETSDFYIVTFTSSVGFELFKINTDTLNLFVDYVPGNTWGVNPNYSRLLSFNNKLYLGGGNLQSSGLSTQLLELPEAACINTITINDNNLEAYLENVLNVGDGIVGNGLVCKESVEVLTTLNLSGSIPIVNFPPGLGITNLSGIEHFSALEVLRVEGNNIATLDLSQNTSLRELRAWRCNIQTLNVTGLANLQTVGLNFNQIATADFSTCPAIQELDITDNDLTAIQLGTKANLIKFTISNNPNLTSLDISGADTNLTTFNTTGNTALTCIQVSNVANAQAQANWTKDTTTTYSLNCGNQPFTVTTSIGGDVVDTDPEACCTSYEITEGGLLEIYFEADAIATLGEEYIVQLSLSGSVATEADISNRENSPTLQYTYSVKAGNPDNTMQIDILNDGIEELGGENLKLTFTAVGSNYSFTGTTVYDITINDQPTTPYTVAANLTNAGSLPNYTVTEGQTFNLNLNADATAQNGTVYNPIITVTRNGVDATADFSISGLNQPITVNNGVNPDGSIQFTANDDGNDTGDQVYTITVASENTANYTIQTPETFVVTVTDALNAPILLRTTVIGATPNGNNYEILEGQTLEIQIEAINGVDGTSFTIPLDLSNTTAQTADYTGPETSFEVTVDTNVNPDGVLTYVIVANDGDDAGEVLDIILNQPAGYQWEEVAGDGFLRISVTINEPSNSLFSVTPSILGEVTGTSPNFEIIEGQSFNLNFNANSNANIGDSYNPIISITQNGVDASSDFTIDNLDRNFIVNTTNPDGSIQFVANSSSTEAYAISINSEDSSIYTVNNPSEFYVTVNEASQNQGNIVVKIDNRGGTEGYEINEQITLNLENNDGTTFITNEELIFNITTNLTNIEQDNWAEENDFELLSTTIVVPAGSSKGLLEISYENRTDLDDNHEFYNIVVTGVNKLEDQIRLPEPFLVKIIDKDGMFDVFLTYEGDGLKDVILDENSCCFFRTIYVEEGTSIFFSFEAEKGAPIGQEFDVIFDFQTPQDSESLGTNNNDVPFANEGRTGAENDFYLNAPNPNQSLFTDFSVQEKEPDNFLEVVVRNNDILGEDLERFRVTIDKANSGDIMYNLLNAIDIEFVIEEPVFASIESNPDENLAKESPLTPASFIVSINEISLTPTVILYELDEESSADEDEDFEMLLGEVTIPAGQLATDITVIPKDDDRFEVINETVIINLIDGSGYTLSNSSRAQIEIESEDEADYTATIIKGEDNTSSESFEDDFAEIILELNESPEVNVEVHFKISNQTKQNEVIEGEGQDYLIYQANKETVIPPNNRKVVFEANGGTRKSIFVKALFDTVDEDNESLFLELDEGVNYSSGTPNEAEVILQSATTDLTSFNPNSISVVSKKPRCPGDNQEGFIEISNASGFEFDIVIYDDTENEVDRFLLGTNSSTDRLKNSKPLTIGRYELILEFKGEKPEDAIAPRYVVQIEKLDDMSVEEQGVDLKSRIGRFIVSGSQSYTLSTQIGEYRFDFEDTNEHLITLPLGPGLNSIEIKGDAVCQGTLKKEILLDDIYIFPNPTYEIVSIIGDSLKEFKGLVLFDMQGKLVFEKTTSDSGINKMEINISGLQKGMYLGKIHTMNNQKIEFKLIKR